ncbi:MAG: type III-B CRISPR module RAMP protein Cmr1 [Candidatus Asgardarchaeum sp.]
MHSAEFTLEAVTPIFMYGADTNVPEIRASAIKGLLRWWFRAILGGVKFSQGIYKGNVLLEKVKEEEKIWGTTNEKSKVIVKVFPIKLYKKPFPILLKGERLRERGKGIKYLGFGVSNKVCITYGSKIKITIAFRSRVSRMEENKVLASLWLLLNLGNIGSRCRRGFGSLRVEKDITIDEIEFRSPANVNDLEKYLKAGVQKCLDLFGWKGVSVETQSLPEFSMIVPKFWKMKILDDIYSSPLEAINELGIKIREYREDRDNPFARHTRATKTGKRFAYWVTKDYNAVKSIYSSQMQSSTPQGSIFGLPHQFQFQSINKKAIVTGLTKERRASPLFIKIWKLAEREYVVGLQLFLSKFVPTDKLQISDLRNPKIGSVVNAPSYNFLIGFLNRLRGRWLTL